MNQNGSHLAEDSCFIKYHSQDTSVTATTENPDVEKGQVKRVERPGEKPVTSQSTKAPNGKGIFDPNQIPETDVSTVNGEDDKDDFPEGGLKGWSVVLGSFCGSFSVFGIINSTAILLDYLQQNQLKEYSPSALGWIFGTALFLT
jgi:hypothetical protein